MQLNDHWINIWDTKSYAEFLTYLFRKNLLTFFIKQSISTKKKGGSIKSGHLQNHCKIQNQKGMDYFSQ